MPAVGIPGKDLSRNETFDLQCSLRAIAFLRELDTDQVKSLAKTAESLEFSNGDLLMETGKPASASFYYVLENWVMLERPGEDQVKIPQGLYFGDELLKLGEGNKNASQPVDAPFTVIAGGPSPDSKVRVAKLTLEECRKVVDKIVVSDKSFYARRKSTVVRNHDGSFSSLNDSQGQLGSSMSSITEQPDPEDTSFSQKKLKKKSSGSDKIKKIKSPKKSPMKTPSGSSKKKKAWPESGDDSLQLVPEIDSDGEGESEKEALPEKKGSKSLKSPKKSPLKSPRKTDSWKYQKDLSAETDGKDDLMQLVPELESDDEDSGKETPDHDNNSNVDGMLSQKARLNPPDTVPVQVRRGSTGTAPAVLTGMPPSSVASRRESTGGGGAFKSRWGKPKASDVSLDSDEEDNRNNLVKSEEGSESNDRISNIRNRFEATQQPLPSSPQKTPKAPPKFMMNKKLNSPFRNDSKEDEPAPAAKPPTSPSRKIEDIKSTFLSPPKQKSKKIELASPRRLMLNPDQIFGGGGGGADDKKETMGVGKLQMNRLNVKGTPSDPKQNTDVNRLSLDRLKVRAPDLSNDLPPHTDKNSTWRRPTNNESDKYGDDSPKPATSNEEEGKEQKTPKAETKKKKPKTPKPDKTPKTPKAFKAKKEAELPPAPDAKSPKPSKFKMDKPPVVGAGSEKLHKARQTFEVGSTKTKEQAKKENVPAPLRPALDLYQKPITTAPDYKAPVYKKSAEDVRRISRVLSTKFAFKNLGAKNLKTLIDSFEPAHCKAGEELMNKDKGNDYMYIVSRGRVGIERDGEEVDEVEEGGTVGDLNLMFDNANRNEVVRAKEESELFRVDQNTYRSILQHETKQEDDRKRYLINKIRLFDNVSERNKEKLAVALEPVYFDAGSKIVSTDDYDKAFCIVSEGKVRCHDPASSSTKGDRVLGEAGYFGETALLTTDARPIDATAESDGVLYKIDRERFEKILGEVRNVIVSPLEARVLYGLDCLNFSKKGMKADEAVALVAKIRDITFAKGQRVIVKDTDNLAALYFLRQGKLVQQKGTFENHIIPGGIFGEEFFLKAKNEESTVAQTNYNVVAVDRSVCGVLTIKDWYEVKKKFRPDKGKKEKETKKEEKEDPKRNVKRQKSMDKWVPKAETIDANASDSDEDEADIQLIEHNKIHFENLVKKVCLGEGNFGQVWMVYDKAAEKPVSYALKIQSKYQLVQEQQAEAVIREKNAMARFNHPNIIRLAGSYKDTHFVYMLLPMIQGGELFSVIHPIEDDSQSGLPEKDAKFYAFAVADALAYMQQRKYVYRDMKPENILIDEHGYPIIIDFGFAKKVGTEKTFTLCGSPGYVAPEMCLSLGHSYAADHWSFGILIYEMLVGESPFFYYGCDPTELYRAICEDDYEKPKNVSEEVCELIDGLLQKDPTLRLGSLAGGVSDISGHKWFDGMDIHAMRNREIPAPWKPEIKDAFDTSNFDDWSDLEDKSEEKYPVLKGKKAALFDEF